MASFPLNSKPHFHSRSNSLPTRPHPLVIQCQEQLERLRLSSSSSSLSQKLGGLQNLHDCVEKLVQLPLTQEAILQEHQENSVDELLDGSLKILDVCTAAKDSILHTKECTRELQSIIRRRRRGGGGEVELTVEAKKFLNSRKVVRKAILKALEIMKDKAKKGNSSSSSSSSCNLVSFLREVEELTLSTFESLMNFISGSTQAKPNSWFVVSKLMQTRKVAVSQESEENEFALVDSAIQSFVLNLTSKKDHGNNLQNQLENLETRIQDLEEGLEFLFKRLIKTRVAILNMFNH